MQIHYYQVFIYLLLFISFVALLLFFKSIFRKQITPFQIIFFASLLPLFSLLRKGVHESGDFALHITRAVDLWNSLSYGIFPVHWAALLNATYGYPLFLFTYPLPYYSIAALKFIGFSFIAGEKIVIATTFVASGIGMYLLARQLLKPLNSALASVLYLFAPYHLVDMHFRVAIGELFAYAALPFVFYFMILAHKSKKPYAFLALTASFGALILSHQAIALISAPFVFLLPLFLRTDRTTLLFLHLSLFLSLLITSFYWLPLLSSIQYTHQMEYSKNIGFENPLLYLFSPWKYTLLYQGPHGQLSFPMGFVQLGLFAYALYLLRKKKIVKKIRTLLLGLIMVFVFLTFLLLPISELLWKILPFMTNFQFAYRLMLPISFLLALIGGIASIPIKNKAVLYSIIISAIFITIPNWGTRTVIPDITDKYLISRTPYATYEAEGLQPASPKWRNGNSIWIQNPPSNPIEVIRGKASVTELERTPTSHVYKIEVSKRSLFYENTFYFPGWNLYANGKAHEFNYIDNKKSNLIYFVLKPGTYVVELKYEPPPVSRFANYLSFGGLALWVGIAIYFSFHRRK